METYRATIRAEHRKQATTAALKKALRGLTKKQRRAAFERAASPRQATDAAPL